MAVDGRGPVHRNLSPDQNLGEISHLSACIPIVVICSIQLLLLFFAQKMLVPLPKAARTGHIQLCQLVAVCPL